MSGDSGLETVVGLLHDEHAREILVATSVEPMTSADLAARCDASRQTVYRRLEELEASDLVVERTRPRADGHHEAVYVAALDWLHVELREGRLEYDLECGEPDMADELNRLWGDI